MLDVVRGCCNGKIRIDEDDLHDEDEREDVGGSCSTQWNVVCCCSTLCNRWNFGPMKVVKRHWEVVKRRWKLLDVVECCRTWDIAVRC